MTPLIDAVRAFLAMATHGRALPLDANEFAEGDPMRAYLEALNDLHAAVEDAAAKAREDALEYIAGFGQTQTALEQRDEARGVARQLWTDGGYETSAILPHDHPWLLKVTP